MAGATYVDRIDSMKRLPIRFDSKELIGDESPEVTFEMRGMGHVKVRRPIGKFGFVASNEGQGDLGLLLATSQESSK